SHWIKKRPDMTVRSCSKSVLRDFVSATSCCLLFRNIPCLFRILRRKLGWKETKVFSVGGCFSFHCPSCFFRQRIISSLLGKALKTNTSTSTCLLQSVFGFYF